MYSILAYLCFFRLDELQQQDLRKIIQSQEAYKMATFLTFTFSEEMLKQHLREVWMPFYDVTYID